MATPSVAVKQPRSSLGKIERVTDKAAPVSAKKVLPVKEEGDATLPTSNNLKQKKKNRPLAKKVSSRSTSAESKIPQTAETKLAIQRKETEEAQKKADAEQKLVAQKKLEAEQKLKAAAKAQKEAEVGKITDKIIGSWESWKQSIAQGLNNQDDDKRLNDLVKNVSSDLVKTELKKLTPDECIKFFGEFKDNELIMETFLIAGYLYVKAGHLYAEEMKQDLRKSEGFSFKGGSTFADEWYLRKQYKNEVKNLKSYKGLGENEQPQMVQSFIEFTQKSNLEENISLSVQYFDYAETYFNDLTDQAKQNLSYDNADEVRTTLATILSDKTLANRLDFTKFQKDHYLGNGYFKLQFVRETNLEGNLSLAFQYYDYAETYFKALTQEQKDRLEYHSVENVRDALERILSKDVFKNADRMNPVKIQSYAKTYLDLGYYFVEAVEKAEDVQKEVTKSKTVKSIQDQLEALNKTGTLKVFSNDPAVDQLNEKDIVEFSNAVYRDYFPQELNVPTDSDVKKVISQTIIARIVFYPYWYGDEEEKKLKIKTVAAITPSLRKEDIEEVSTYYDFAADIQRQGFLDMEKRSEILIALMNMAEIKTALENIPNSMKKELDACQNDDERQVLISQKRQNFIKKKLNYVKDKWNHQNNNVSSQTVVIIEDDIAFQNESLQMWTTYNQVLKMLIVQQKQQEGIAYL